MFQEICLACGKDVPDGRPYCNDLCQEGDLTSPALSESSSAFSSPHLQYAHGQDVPALVPSALGRALRAYTAHDRYSASSSSASSTSWSVLTDDDDELHSEYDLDVQTNPARPGLSYARRPSGTNNRSTVPRLHRRTDSDPHSLVGAGCPQSAPSVRAVRLGGPPSDDDDLDLDLDLDLSDADDELASDDPVRPRTDTITAAPAQAKARRKRNRASLPAYFSMLQGAATSPTSGAGAGAALPPPYPYPSPISSSSGHTLPARPSPPTPKLSLLAGLAHAHAHHAHAQTAPPTPAHAHSYAHHAHAHAHAHHQTPRGRRRESTRRAAGASSPSRSPSPSRRRDSDEKVADWSNALARGRAKRRNSSSSPPPPPPALPAAAMLPASPVGRAGSESGSRARTRGRARVDELDGFVSPERPGFGHGRSGLLAREGRREEGWVAL
ncbi:hypothetical protein B0H15DRAFT_801911 [Mycena belliarum]|uniref:Uncharacterized protein n=1 Tax=Mycena belliarum TaxID=1033014 RepID=A0AAD6U1M3_9AGAR|nr:hypothetical protein B0H15DRAFT_801911 [Mycena belliae]